MAEPFGDLLAAAVRRAGNPVCVGLDPRVDQLPRGMLSDCGRQNPEAIAAAYLTFCMSVIDVVAPLVGVVKPQAAFFEQLGPPGTAALATVVAAARKAGLLVIVDGKRNDIGTTAEAYAQGYLGAASPWSGDALTVSPYLGDDSLTPFVDVAKQTGSGIFVLVKTSNKGGAKFQDLVADGKPLYRHVGAYVEQLAAETAGKCGYGSVGAVVGATYPEQQHELRTAMPHTWFLVPGFGAQGGSAKDVAGAFDAQGLGAVVNNSRGLIFAFSLRQYEAFGEERWQAATEAATIDMIGALANGTTSGKLEGR
jgi:orotidine-5'-phosphate decarboxylase